MGTRLEGLMNRIQEARRLSTPSAALGYLGSHYWARVRSHVPMDLPVFTVTIPVAGEKGRTVRAVVRSNSSDWIVLRGVFLDKEYAVAPEFVGVRRILDIGANCGYAALYFSTAYPDAEILAVEPLPANAAICAENIRTNAVRCELVQVAAANEDGTAELLLTDSDSCQSLVPLHNWTEKLTVTTMSIPTLLKRKGWDAVDLLKVDIEGYEKELFRDGPSWLSRVRVIVGELHGDYDLKALDKDIGRLGFKSRLLSDGYEKTFIAQRA